jgi:hypothetical protein
MVACLIAAGCATPRPEGSAADTPQASGAGLGAGSTGVGARMDSLPPVLPSTNEAHAPVVLELDRTRYAPGASVRLRIVNRSGLGYGYNACTRVIERQLGSSWTRVAEAGRACTMELRILGPNETATQQVELPRPLPAGDYRLVLSLSREEGPPPGPGIPTPGPVRATSAPFRVD